MATLGQIVWENENFCKEILTNQCSYQVLMKICIDDNSLSKYISLVLQMYLAVLAIAKAFRKLCLTAKGP